MNWELVLAAEPRRFTIGTRADGRWRVALPRLLGDFQQLLMDTLDLMQELGGADARHDSSFWHLPSIEPHSQNRGYQDWVMLIEFLRDAWLNTRDRDPARALQIAQQWFEVPYPTFKRLALFAASQDNCIVPPQWVNWLLTDNSWWLWAIETKREVCRLFALQGRHLGQAEQALLETAILAGPLREMYRPDIEPDAWQVVVDRSVWFSLAKLRASGLVLGEGTAARFDRLSNANPVWQLAADDIDELSHWSSGPGDVGYEEDLEIAPRRWRQLVTWLREPRPDSRRRPLRDEPWIKVCRERFFHSIWALRELARNDEWPPERWRTALQCWSDGALVVRSWRFAAALVERMPDSYILEIAPAVARWLEEASKAIIRDEATLLGLCFRILRLPLEGDTSITINGHPADPLTAALNHPVGTVTQAILHRWLKRELHDGDRLSGDIEPLLTDLCDLAIDRFRHGRVILASRLIVLFRADRPWTTAHLLPLFDWNSNPEEARASWAGFLWSPQIYPPLLLATKPQFLETAHHYADLGEHAQPFVAFLTYAALEPPDGFDREDFRQALEALPQKGLEHSARAVLGALEATDKQREEYWSNRVKPFWGVWPKSADRASLELAETWGCISIAAGSKFSEALEMIRTWLSPLAEPSYLLHRLDESGQCRKQPSAALRLLDAIIGDRTKYAIHLRECLDSIVEAEPALARDSRYQRLREHLRIRGG